MCDVLGFRELAHSGPHDLHGAMVHNASSAQTHLTRVRLRELLCSGSGAPRSWDPMVVEILIQMLKEKLKYISSLLSLGVSVDAFLRTWTSSVHPFVG
jgi:hypothetical protein